MTFILSEMTIISAMIWLARALVLVSSAGIIAYCFPAMMRGLFNKSLKLGDYILTLAGLYSSVFLLFQIRFFGFNVGDDDSVYTFICLCAALFTQIVFLTVRRKLLEVTARGQIWLANADMINALVDLWAVCPEEAEAVADAAADRARDITLGRDQCKS